MSFAPRVAAFLLVFGITAFATTHAHAQKAQKKAALIAEYCQRAEALKPGDAEARYQLGAWCQTNGLTTKAVEEFQAAVALDSDHAEARAALGFVRYGTGWKTKAELARLRRAKPDVDEVVDEDPAPGAPSATDIEDPEVDPEVVVEDVKTQDIFEAQLAAKKAWADAAAEAFQTEFQTIEGADFLIHTTLPSSRDKKVQDLMKLLKLGKKTLVKFLGVRGKAKLWPSKLQFVLLRSQEEFERFADTVDGIADVANTGGAYVGEEGHTVLWKPTSEVVVHQMGETVFDYLHESDRWVSWWIAEGVGELLATTLLSANGKISPDFRKNYAYANDSLQDKDGATTIYTLLETREYRGRERGRKRALAMTFVDFLYRNKRSGFHRLIKRLKSEEAPPVPTTESEDDLKKFFLDYLTFQQTAFQKSIGKIDKTELSWKKWVTSQSASLGKASGRSTPKPAPTSRR